MDDLPEINGLFTGIDDGDRYEFLGVATAIYSEEAGNEPEPLYVLRKQLSGSEHMDLPRGTLPLTIVRPEQFDDLFEKKGEG